MMRVTEFILPAMAGVLLLLSAYWSCRRFWRQLQQNKANTVHGSGQGPAPPPPELSQVPDGPLPLGDEAAWLAIRCESPEQVIAALGFQWGLPANWSSGLAAVQDGDCVFISPLLDGFVLVVYGWGQPDMLAVLPPGDDREDEVLLAFLYAMFPEVQRFAVSDREAFFWWEKALSGAPVRRHIRQGDRVLLDYGALTDEELEAGRRQVLQKGSDVPFSAEDVLDIAAAWGIDPRFETKSYPPSTGWLCYL